jgi:hypothetical protein
VGYLPGIHSTSLATGTPSRLDHPVLSWRTVLPVRQIMFPPARLPAVSLVKTRCTNWSSGWHWGVCVCVCTNVEWYGFWKYTSNYDSRALYTFRWFAQVFTVWTSPHIQLILDRTSYQRRRYISHCQLSEVFLTNIMLLDLYLLSLIDYLVGLGMLLENKLFWIEQS